MKLFFWVVLVLLIILAELLIIVDQRLEIRAVSTVLDQLTTRYGELINYQCVCPYGPYLEPDRCDAQEINI